MNMRVTGSYPAGLTSPVDKRIGDAFPIIEVVYKELDKLKYIAEHSDKFAKRDVELRANMDLRAIEWRYKDQDDWLLMITFSDLVQVDLLTFEQDLYAAIAEAQDWAKHARAVTADVDKIIAETHQARDKAIAAASSTGIFRVFKTKAEAEANTVAVPVGKYIEVLADESYNGYRTRYEKTVNGYEFTISLTYPDAQRNVLAKSVVVAENAAASLTLTLSYNRAARIAVMYANARNSSAEGRLYLDGIAFPGDTTAEWVQLAGSVGSAGLGTLSVSVSGQVLTISKSAGALTGSGRLQVIAVFDDGVS